jgi:putative membrane protein
MPNRLVYRPALAVCLALPAALAGCMAGAGMQDPAAAASAVGMGNEHVLETVMAANRSEVALSRQAEQRAASAEVRGFAARMVAEHTRAETDMAAFGQRLGLSPRESDTSRNLDEFTRNTVASMETRSGAEFDREYMRLQVQQHGWLLEALDKNLIPAAQNERLRAELQRMRPMIAAHLRDAQRIHRILGG